MRQPRSSSLRLAPPAAVLLLSLGCTASPSGPERAPQASAEAGGPATAATLSAHRDGAMLVVRNTGAGPVDVGAVESRFFEEALAQWCFGSPGCGTTVAAGAVLRIPLRDVAGYDAGERAVLVFWWPADPALTPAERAATLRRIEVPVG